MQVGARREIHMHECPVRPCAILDRINWIKWKINNCAATITRGFESRNSQIGPSSPITIISEYSDADM
jgi:hypothetical protein